MTGAGTAGKLQGKIALVTGGSSFARGWTNDLKDRKIRVNVVSPGPVDTPGLSGLAQTEEHEQALNAQLASDVPLGRLGQPEEIAKAAVLTVGQPRSDVRDSAKRNMEKKDDSRRTAAPQLR
jgi:NAD(P)-dependent dehydrogenase (short-subunit alcohol dehydrogenase family)